MQLRGLNKLAPIRGIGTDQVKRSPGDGSGLALAAFPWPHQCRGQAQHSGEGWLADADQLARFQHAPRAAAPPRYLPGVNFRRESFIAAPPERVFAFHEAPGALEKLLPPWEKIRLIKRGDGADAIAALEQAEAWDPANPHLEELLARARLQVSTRPAPGAPPSSPAHAAF